MPPFFTSWALWQQMTFVLAGAIALTFLFGYLKVFSTTRATRRQALLEEERRTRSAGLRRTGVPRGGADIPFGVRAMQSGVEVDGIWISRPSTPRDGRAGGRNVREEAGREGEWPLAAGALVVVGAREVSGAEEAGGDSAEGRGRDQPRVFRPPVPRRFYDLQPSWDDDGTGQAGATSHVFRANQSGTESDSDVDNARPYLARPSGRQGQFPHV